MIQVETDTATHSGIVIRISTSEPSDLVELITFFKELAEREIGQDEIARLPFIEQEDHMNIVCIVTNRGRSMTKWDPRNRVCTWWAGQDEWLTTAMLVEGVASTTVPGFQFLTDSPPVTIVVELLAKD